MIIADMTLPDLIGVFLGFLFTLLVFSYLLGDNPLFRLVVSIFIGVASGYAAVLVFYSVLLPRLFVPILSNQREEQLLAVVPLLLGTLMLTKISPRLARWGTFSMAYLVGVGAAVAIGGSVLGTLFPQTMASFNLLNFQAADAPGENPLARLLNGSIILVGTLTTLAYFHFGARVLPNQPTLRQPWIELLARIGQFFIAVTFGALFAGVYAAALMALVERLFFLVNFVEPLLSPFIS
jgi:hypothetical protein